MKNLSSVRLYLLSVLLGFFLFLITYYLFGTQNLEDTEVLASVNLPNELTTINANEKIDIDLLASSDTGIYNQLYNEVEDDVIDLKVFENVEFSSGVVTYYDVLESDFTDGEYLKVPNKNKKCRSEAITYMDYRTVTSVTSPQYALLNSDKAWTDEKTGLRMYKSRICIAMGSGYASKIGTKINLIMKNGKTVKCILGDQKSNRHTDKTNRFHKKDGSVAEAIVDTEYFKGYKQYPKSLRGKIDKVLVLEE